MIKLKEWFIIYDKNNCPYFTIVKGSRKFDAIASFYRDTPGVEGCFTSHELPLT